MDSFFKLNGQIEDFIEQMEQKVGTIRNSNHQTTGDHGDELIDKDVQNLRIENQKLRYQLAFLKMELNKLQSSNFS